MVFKCIIMKECQMDHFSSVDFLIQNSQLLYDQSFKKYFLKSTLKTKNNYFMFISCNVSIKLQINPKCVFLTKANKWP